jgi:hypothetical protein
MPSIYQGPIFSPITKNLADFFPQARNARFACIRPSRGATPCLAVESAQRALFDVLGHRTRRDFRNTWHFLDWARSNSVDLVPPSPTAGRSPVAAMSNN